MRALLFFNGDEFVDKKGRQNKFKQVVSFIKNATCAIYMYRKGIFWYIKIEKKCLMVYHEEFDLLAKTDEKTEDFISAETDMQNAIENFTIENKTNYKDKALKELELIKSKNAKFALQ